MKYVNADGAISFGQTGAARSDCSDGLLGKILAIHYRNGNNIVTRDDGYDFYSAPFFIFMLTVGNLFMPLVYGYILFGTRKLAVYGRLHKAKVLGRYFESQFEVEFEENGHAEVRKVAFTNAKLRPLIGSTVWILEKNEKIAVRVSKDFAYWDVVAS